MIRCTLLSLLFALVLVVLPGRLAAADDLEIPPGMSGPRPTPECGGAPMLALWEAERVERLQEIAVAVVGAFVHDLEPRLSATATDVERDLVQDARTRYSECLATLDFRDAVCVAAAAGRPELCAAVINPEKRAACRLMATAIRAADTGRIAPCDLLAEPALRDLCVLRATGRPRCSAGLAACLFQLWLSPGSCRSPGILTGWVTGLRYYCRWTLWIEAARGAGDCGHGLAGAWSRGCRAVAARAPAACPPPGRYEAGILLDSTCREQAVVRLLAPVVRWHEGTANLSVTLYNPFREAARCVLHMEAVEPDGRVHRVTTPGLALPGTPRAWRGRNAPVDVMVAPASQAWTWRVRPDCVFALHVLEGVGQAGPGDRTTFSD